MATRQSGSVFSRRWLIRSTAFGAGLAIISPLIAACASQSAAPTAAPQAAAPTAAPAAAPTAPAAAPTQAPTVAPQPTPTPVPILAAPTVTAATSSSSSLFPGPETAKIDWKQFSGTSIGWSGGIHPISETLIKMAPQFTELTGIKVNVEQIDWTVWAQKLQLDLANSTPQYDTFMTVFANDWQFGQAGLITEISQFIEDPKLTDKNWWNLNDISPGLLASAKWDGVAGHKLGSGKLYSIPYVVETYILGYRDDLFQKYNLKVPTTLDEVLPAAKAIAEGEKGSSTSGFAVRGSLDNAPITAVWMSLLPDYGGTDFDAKMNSLIGNNANVKFTDLLVNQILKPYGPTGWIGLTWDDLRHKFADGQYGMVYDCDFFSLLYEDPANSKIAGKLKYANLGGPQGMGGSTFYFGNAINNNSKNKGAAWLFNEWITSPVIMRDFTVKYQNLIPTRLSTWSDPDVQKMVGSWGGGTWLQAVRNNLEKNVRLVLTPEPDLTQVCTVWMGANQKIYSGTPVQAALTDAASQINAIMDKDGLRKQ